MASVIARLFLLPGKTTTTTNIIKNKNTGMLGSITSIGSSITGLAMNASMATYTAVAGVVSAIVIGGSILLS